MEKLFKPRIFFKFLQSFTSIKRHFCKMDGVIIDIRGFWLRTHTKFIAKEVSILFLNSEGGERQKTFLFKPPTSFENLCERDQADVAWTTYYSHGLRWADGEILYEQLQNTILHEIEDVTYIYIEDSNFTKFLQENILKTPKAIIDITSPGFGYQKPLTAKTSTEICKYHLFHRESDNQQLAKFFLNIMDKQSKYYQCATLNIIDQYRFLMRLIKTTSSYVFISQIYLLLNDINLMNTNDIETLGRSLVLKHAYMDIDKAFEKLPISWKWDHEIRGYTYCCEHFTSLFDKSLKFKKDCLICSLKSYDCTK